MGKIELSIKADYVPNWGVWEGLREIMQNGLDAEDEHNAPLKVGRHKGTVHIENQNITLKASALLLGQTSKVGKNLRGSHGEGLDLGLLALVRAGRAVRIRSGSEVWIPSIEFSKTYQENTLVVNIQGGRTNKNRVCVEIEDVEDDEWEQMQERFLHLQEPEDRIDTMYGALLTNARHRGRIFVKGIWVMDDTSLNFGYDYDQGGVTLDRDRRMISDFDRTWQNARIWHTSVATRPDLFNRFVELLETDSSDVAGMVTAAEYGASPDVVKEVAARFLEKHGENAVPVETLEQSKDLEHLGRKGIIVPKTLGEVVKKTLGSLSQITADLRSEVIKKYGWHELDTEEKILFEEAVDLTQGSCPPGLEEILSRIDIVDFRSDSMLGQHKDGRYLVAKKLLSDRNELLATLVHEVAHDAGLDGNRGHVATLESIWSNMVGKLRDLVEEVA